MALAASTEPIAVVGRYSIHTEIAHGGMATVHLGRLIGPAGFSRTVAIKRLHTSYAKDPEFVAMLMDEARLASRIRHLNVVPIIDVVAAGGELLLVMDYVQGESLSMLARAQRTQQEKMDPRIACKIMTEVLAGLHAAHEACSDRGDPLGIVHRDVSPQNVLVGVDGISHVIDFGVAKAVGRVQSTRNGQLKGKLAYMSPEQIRGGDIDRRTDIYAASVVLWEILTGRRLFSGDEAARMYGVLTMAVSPPSSVNPALSSELDAVVLKGLNKRSTRRYRTALEMADALEAVMPPASSREVARWIEGLAGKTLEARATLVSEVESMSHVWVSQPPELASDIVSGFSSSRRIALQHPGVRAALEEMSNPSMSSALGSQASVQPHGLQRLQPELVGSTTTGCSLGSGVDLTVPTRTRWWRAIGLAAGLGLLVAGTWLVARSSAPAQPVEQSAVGGEASIASPPERVSDHAPEVAPTSAAPSSEPAQSVEKHAAVGEQSPPPERVSDDPPEVAPRPAAGSRRASVPSSPRVVARAPKATPVATSKGTVRAQPRPTKVPPKYTRD